MVPIGNKFKPLSPVSHCAKLIHQQQHTNCISIFTNETKLKTVKFERPLTLWIFIMLNLMLIMLIIIIIKQRTRSSRTANKVK